MKSYVVIGLGLFGKELAKDLYEAGHTVLAVDTSEEIVEDIADHVTRAVTADARKKEALEQLGVSNYDCVITAITSDLATPVMITINLNSLNVPEIICKIRDETEREILEKLGASYCVIPEQIAAHNLAQRLSHKKLIDFLKLSENHSIIEMHVPKSWLGHSLKALNVRPKYGVNVIGIRNAGDIHVNFNPENPLKEDDELIIIGSSKNLDVIQKIK